MAPQANENFKDRVRQTDHNWSMDTSLATPTSWTTDKEYENQKIDVGYRATSYINLRVAMLVLFGILFSILCIIICRRIFFKCKRCSDEEEDGELPRRSAQPAISSDRMYFKVAHLFGRVQKEDGVLKFSLPCTLQSNIPLPSSSSTQSGSFAYYHE
ncbi:hypothetical protein DSO57_1015729 [Entomophthora muscae]|uniref:Uncharacterized protein n=1 Tax=Entomophthora muscae TaxID=34485 RepID=A0ACC2RWA1_9FUNG|nr:hypothetical protein DSO57_1015729 [Entomophthora muscae]